MFTSVSGCCRARRLLPTTKHDELMRLTNAATAFYHYRSVSLSLARSPARLPDLHSRRVFAVNCGGPRQATLLLLHVEHVRSICCEPVALRAVGDRLLSREIL